MCAFATGRSIRHLMIANKNWRKGRFVTCCLSPQKESAKRPFGREARVDKIGGKENIPIIPSSSTFFLSSVSTFFQKAI